jgi:hypothetical protein
MALIGTIGIKPLFPWNRDKDASRVAEVPIDESEVVDVTLSSKLEAFVCE